jgi:hypothetical protein
MSRTERTPHLFRRDRFGMELLRVGVAGGAAAVLLTACGGGDSGSDSAAATSAAAQDEETAPTGEVADFCAQAGAIDDRVDAALNDLEGDDASVVDGFRQLATEFRGVQAPEAITADWTAMADGLDRMADAFQDVDFTDLDSLDALDQAESGLTGPSDNVDQYLEDECGI